MREILIIILIVSLAMDSKGQSVSMFGTEDYYDTIFRQSVKSCDEFMCRFNEEEFFPDLEKNDPQLGQKNFLMLFDYEMAKDKNKDDFLKQVFLFYNAVKTNGTKLKYESKNWYAEQRIMFFFNKKPIELCLILQPDKTPKKLSCWTVVGVNGLEKVGYKDAVDRMAISPEQHEAEFIELESVFKFNSKNFSQFRSYNCHLDALSYFFALVEKGMLVFDKRISTTFHFFDVPSYVFSVNYFNRKKSNTGWLISEYKKVSYDEKESILNKLLSK